MSEEDRRRFREVGGYEQVQTNTPVTPGDDVVDLAGLITWLDNQNGAAFSKWQALTFALAGVTANYYGHKIKGERVIVGAGEFQRFAWHYRITVAS